MSVRMRLLCGCVLGLAVAVSAAPDEGLVQGLYEGTCQDAVGSHAAEIRLVAMGNNAYKALVRRCVGEKLVARMELDGTAGADTVVLAGKVDGASWTATWTAGALEGTSDGGGSLTARRVVKESPTLGRAAPDGAVQLLGGTKPEAPTEMMRGGGRTWYVGDMSMNGAAVWEVPIRMVSATDPKVWPTKDNMTPEGWTLTDERRRVDVVLGIDEDGSLQVPQGGMNSKQRFEGSFDAHVEYMCPLRATARSQGRGNSGVFLPCGTEIQVLDSFGACTYLGGGCGGLYRWKNPDTMDVLESAENKNENKFNLSSRPPLQWQTYDVEYRVRKDDKGNPAGYLTVFHNGIKIHDNVKLQRPPRNGNFSFQDHGNPVRYRNIWVHPRKDN